MDAATKWSEADGECPRCDGEGGYRIGTDDRCCHCCKGTGRVANDGRELCPACFGERDDCRLCRGAGLVGPDDFARVADEDAEEAEDRRMERRGLHWSGVPLDGPF